MKTIILALLALIATSIAGLSDPPEYRRTVTGTIVWKSNAGMIVIAISVGSNIFPSSEMPEIYIWCDPSKRFIEGAFSEMCIRTNRTIDVHKDGTKPMPVWIIAPPLNMGARWPK